MPAEQVPLIRVEPMPPGAAGPAAHAASGTKVFRPWESRPGGVAPRLEAGVPGGRASGGVPAGPAPAPRPPPDSGGVYRGSGAAAVRSEDIGQIKGRGFRHVSLRGLVPVRGECNLVCAVHLCPRPFNLHSPHRLLNLLVPWRIIGDRSITRVAQRHLRAPMTDSSRPPTVGPGGRTLHQCRRFRMPAGDYRTDASGDQGCRVET